MSTNFYSDKLLLVTPFDTHLEHPGVEVRKGDIKSMFLDLIRDSLNDKIYKKILVIQDQEVISDLVKLDSIISTCVDLEINLKDIFFRQVVHDGLPEKCTVDESIILCSSWTFPILSNSPRRSNNLYEDCFSHRLTIKSLPSI